MNAIECGSKKGKKRHFVDADRYKRLSRSKALCGIEGKKLVLYDAVFFNYKLVYPLKCKECFSILRKANNESKKKETS